MSEFWGNLVVLLAVCGGPVVMFTVFALYEGKKR